MRNQRSSAVCLADLLWLAQASGCDDAAAMAASAQALDWPFTPEPIPMPPPAGFRPADDTASPPPPPPPPPPPKGISHKLPLRAPALLSVESHIDIGPLPQGPLNPGDWQPCDPAEVKQWFCVPAVEAKQALQPVDASPNLIQQLASSLPQALASRRVDWVAVCERVARLQALNPLPHLIQAAPASHCVVLIDQSSHLRLWWSEWASMVLSWLRFRGDTGLEVWRLPQGPLGPWVAAGSEVRRTPWCADTAVLILSDFGACVPDARPQKARLQEDWRQWLTRHQADAVPLVGLVPAGAQTSAKLRPLLTTQLFWGAQRAEVETEQVTLGLLQALSVCPWFDAGVLRACRVALWPESGPAVEAQVWASEHFSPAGWERDWKRESRDPFAAALLDADEWPLERLMTLVDVHLQRCALAPPVHADVVVLNLAACLESRGITHTQLELRAELARTRQAKLAGHLLSGALPQRDGQPAVAGHVAGFAHARGVGLTPAARQQHRALASQWWALDAAFDVQGRKRAAKPLDVDDSALRRLLERQGGGESRTFELRQRGTELCLFQSPAKGAAGAMLRDGIELAGALLGVKWASKAEWEFLNLSQCDQRHGLVLGSLPAPSEAAPAVEHILRIQSASAFSAFVVQRLARPHWASVFKAGQSRSPDAHIEWPNGEETLLPWWQGQGFLDAHLSGWVLELDQWGPRLTLWQNVDQTSEPFEKLPQTAFRYLPPATFLMGSPEGVGDDDEHPQHPVTLTQGLWLAETPCTQALWQAVMGHNPSHFNKGLEAPQRPVEQVSWDDVQQFLAKLNVLLPEGCEAVLPTEAQWEYACRAGTTTEYWWGDEPDESKANWGGRQKGTTPVDRYPPNPWGLRDMHGNVWEWCADGELRTYELSTARDPMGDTGGDDRVVRGGSWADHPGHARSAFRFSWHLGFLHRFLGFRFALRSSSPQGAGAPARRAQGG